jgi:hypothetical protein
MGLALGLTLHQDVRVVLDASSDAFNIGTLSPNGAKASFGVAYVQAICSHAGVGFDPTSADQDVLAVDGTINFAIGPARVQIKCTGQFRINSGATATWPSEPGWTNKWSRSRTPVYFILVVVDPADQVYWLDYRDDGTMHNAAAFWVRVNGLPEDANIVIPKTQRLTADTLKVWAAEVDACYEGGAQ